MEIRIFNVKDKPFGPLSNNYNYPLELDNRRWKTPRNYIYGNMFWEFSRKTLVGNSPVKDVYDTFLNQVSLQRETTIRQSLSRAFSVVFDNNDAKEALLATGDKKLVLEHNGNILGSGVNGEGVNIYGVQLEQYREHLIALERAAVKRMEYEYLEDKMYKIYLVYDTLKRHMSNGNDIDEYIQMTYDQILDNLDTSRSLKKYDFIKLHKENRLSLPSYVIEQFTNENTLFVAVIRAKEIGNLQLKRKWQRKDNIFRFYLRDLIAENYPDLSEQDQDIAINQTLNPTEYNDLKNKVVDLYERGMLNENIAQDIDIFLLNMVEITQQDILEAQKALTKTPVLEEDIKSISSRVSSKSKSSITSSKSDSSADSSKPAPSISSQGSQVYVRNPFDQEEKEESYLDLLMSRNKPSGGQISLQTQKIDNPADRPRLKSSQIKRPTARLKDLTNMYLQPQEQQPIPPLQTFQPPKSAIQKPNIYTIRHQDILAPSTYLGMLTIKANRYPTISHYITACLLSDLYNVDTDNDQIGSSLAHRLIMAYPDQPTNDPQYYVALESLPKIYKQHYNISFAARLKRNTVKALDKKFTHRYFQDILLLSGNAKLVYADLKSPILGIGPNRDGENFVGNHLMFIRQTLRNERKQIPEEITVSDIESVINKDPFLKKWVMSRTKDMIASITFMGLYLCEKQDMCTDIAEKLVKTILSHIYQPCSHLTAMTRSVKTPVPKFYTDLVKSSINSSIKIDSGAIRVLWNYIVTMIYFIIKHTPSTTDIRKVISMAQQITSSSKSCDGPLEDSFENCILLAITKILLRVKQYNADSKRSTTFNDQDMILVVRLILGQFIKLEDISEIGVVGELDELDTKIITTMEGYGIKEEDFSQGLSSMIPMIKGVIEFILKHQTPQSIKMNRINFYRS